ncbi:hypothetical protein [Rossellomorea yichunensis]|uniref:hypothetical protein n=1 Tax=Rossellomorea yichunensis TaxID=3077331 RepID=UPI0028DF7948|nr:hypothetical protein [Rossellomorea sp. YC4-1]MDT9027252.1 hypothetical protein [Rossellomorea sp. YC4-1]
MKEFNGRLHKKYYYMIVSFIIVLMIAGLLVDNPVNSRFSVHGVMIVIISGCLLIYPWYENAWMRYMTVVSSTFFFLRVVLLVS